MSKLNAFLFLSLNGFFKGPNDDITWHKHGSEEMKYSEKMLKQNNILLFGRKTYQLMEAFWPSPAAKDMYPKVAEGMNKAEKLVFTRTPFEPIWEKTKVISGDIIENIKTLKASAGKDMTILGSGSIIDLLTDSGLIDEYQFMIDPVAIPDGTTIFKGIKNRLDLQLTDSMTFKSGIVLLYYRRV